MQQLSIGRSVLM